MTWNTERGSKASDRCAWRKTTRLAICSMLVLLVGCGAPGAPPLVSRAAAGAHYIPACQNVSPDARSAIPFTTTFYLTTSGSAFREGAADGLRDGLRDGGATGAYLISAMRPPRRVGQADLVATLPPPEPFCMVVDAPHGRVDAAVSQVMSDLSTYGYRARRSTSSPVAFETDFAFRSHSAARWTDRFIAFADPMGPGKTAVFVYRDVFISRNGGPYIQGESVGANETWILAAVRQIAAQR